MSVNGFIAFVEETLHLALPSHGISHPDVLQKLVFSLAPDKDVVAIKIIFIPVGDPGL